ncbi:hypothetical protein DN069_33865 [Streptacidiphilus pinicola]|uniref:Uncharacterized protein n=1 Tax=Streptacidiphilus pinicola TaxID=2219663 RepID=A0A2X0K1I9_9ACTN|nr:hypothetical protein DN069_33865 [Streptacidiphilus pinicola]
MRQTGFVTATVFAFLVINAQAAAATTGSTGGSTPGMLAPFNVPSSEGVPLDHYQLVSDPGGMTDFQQSAQSYLMGMCFALVRIVVGLECWLIHWAYSFPVTKMMAAKSQALADGYRTWVVDQLGLPGMLLAWAVVVCSVMLLRGRTGRAAGELALTFLIVGVASAGLLRPDVVLGSGGLLDQARQASLEVASITTNQGAAPPATVDPASISGPLEQTLTSTFVVEPYQLLQFGRPIPRGDKAYDTYLASVAMNGGPTGGGTPAANPHACDGLAGMPAQACQLGQTSQSPPPSCDGLSGGTKIWCLQGTGRCDQLSGATKILCDMGSSQSSTSGSGGANCDKLMGLAKHFCQAAPPTNGSTTDQAKALADRFKDVDPAISAYVAPPSWDRVFGAMLLLFAALVVLVMVVAMVLALFAAQAADALLAALDYPALVWAILPGPNRGVLWRWLGSFVTSILVLFTASIFLPVFGLTCAAFLSGGQDLITKMFLVDLVALVALGFHRRIMAGASTAGSRLANRMRWARIGGSGSGDGATRTGQVIAGALAAGGPGGFGGMASGYALFAGGNPAHAHLARRAGLLSSARALADIPGAPLHAGRLLGDIGREAAHGLAPVTLAARGVHHAWKGRALTPEEFEARRIQPGAGGGLPVGSRLHNRLIQTRGGRVLLGGSRLAWGASFGAPATWTRARRRIAAGGREVRGQVAHYNLERKNYWHTEWKPGFDDMTTPARLAEKAAAAGGARLHVAADVYGRPAVEATKRAAVNTATAAVLRTGPAGSATGGDPVQPERSHSRVASDEERARAEILHALRRAQREARGESGGEGS